MKRIIVFFGIACIFISIRSQSITFNATNSCYVYTDNPSGKQIQLWVPSRDSVIRGILVDGNAGTATNNANVKSVQDFAAKFSFAYSATSGVDGWNTYTVNAKIFTSALKAMAGLGYQPELVNVPIIGFGSSSAGANAYSLENYMPGKNICSTPNVPALCSGSFPSSTLDSTLSIPTLFTTGVYDPCFSSQNTIVSNARGRDGQWAFIPIQGMAHEHRRTQFIVFRMWEKMIEARLPKNYQPRLGPAALIPYPYDSGWIADQTTFNTGFTAITSKLSYAGAKSTGSWLPDKELAVLYRTLTSYSPPMWLSVEGLPDFPPLTPSVLAEFKPGDTINLVCDVSKYSHWKKIEFYRGLNKIAERYHTPGSNPFRASCLVRLGYETYAQPFYVIGYDSSDVPKTTQLYTVLVFGSGKAQGEKLSVAVDAGDVTKPSVPSNIVTVQNTAHHIKISWNASSDNNGIRGYEVYSGGKCILFTTYTMFSYDSLQPGIAYGPFMIVAVDLKGNRSDSSAQYSITTAPSAPADIAASNITYQSAKITWDAATSAVAIKKYRITGCDALTGANAFTVESSTNSVTLSSLLASTFYKITVVAIDINDNVSAPGEGYVYTSKGPVAIPGLLSDQSVSIFPNPASESFFISFPGGTANITITDMSGTIIRSIDAFADGATVSADGLARGVYLVSVKNAAVSKVVRLLLQ